MWDVGARRLLGALRGYIDWVVFSPDGKTLATTGREGRDGRYQTVRLWNVAVPHDLLSAICAIAGGSLTREEWNRYAPREEFHCSCP